MGLTAPVAALVGAAIPTMVDVALEGAPSLWTIAGFTLAIVAIWLITRPEPPRESQAEVAKTTMNQGWRIPPAALPASEWPL